MPSIFVAGCGFVGLATARLFHERGWEVIGGTHSEESAERLSAEPFRVISADITDRSALGRLAELRGVDASIHCASSGRGGAEQYRQVYIEGARALYFMLEPRRLVFTSSTSVYAQNDGSSVDENSPAEPDRDTGKILREAEQFVVARGGSVARLAGIYGPGRSVLLQKFLSGQAVIEDGGTRFVNQIHRDDAAAALVHIVEKSAPGIFNVADDSPTTQSEIYQFLSGHFHRPLPPEGAGDPNRKRGVTNKRVSNARVRALGWVPKYPSFATAIGSDPRLFASLT